MFKVATGAQIQDKMPLAPILQNAVQLEDVRMLQGSQQYLGLALLTKSNSFGSKTSAAGAACDRTDEAERPGSKGFPELIVIPDAAICSERQGNL